MYSVLILFSVNCFILKLHGFMAKLMDYGTDIMGHGISFCVGQWVPVLVIMIDSNNKS